MFNPDKKFVLLSVFNKKGIVKFAKALNDLGYEIISTEGTGKELSKGGVPFIEAEKISDNPKGLEDCIKTISFRIEAGIVFDRNNATQAEVAQKLDLTPIDMVVSNFPPIEEVIKKPADFNISKVDVGGPLMVRAAAVNFHQVIVVVDPEDYGQVINTISDKGFSSKFKQQLAIKAFNYCAQYDKKIVKYLRSTNLS